MFLVSEPFATTLKREKMCSIKMGFLIGTVIVIFLITSVTIENNDTQSVIVSNTSTRRWYFLFI
jgi:hypothetical protein